SVFPSGERARASGWAPTGAATGRTDSVLISVGAPAPLTSSTEIVSSLVLVTNRRVLSALNCTASGECPTPTNDTSFGAAGLLTSTTETVPPLPAPRPASSAQFETYSR